jgi:membrane-associated protease RseP (regulator of RpoE activity)
MEILVIIVCVGLIPAAIAQSKGRDFLGWWIYGSALFIVALPHSLLIKKDTQRIEREQLQSGNARKCPFCAEIIKIEARVCRFCGRDLPPDDAVGNDGGDLIPAAYLRAGCGGMIGISWLGTEAGMQVKAVTPGGPAASAGFLPGDVILSVDGSSVKGLDEAEPVKSIAYKKEGETINVCFVRNGDTKSASVVVVLHKKNWMRNYFPVIWAPRA